ncbi:hypothetical protein LPJ53_006448 [Coemansia erecta]|uniref:Mob1/phocein n=1 Tax=Coemansia erecta TaxID=147472 RepID=A0A9W8CML8_9FUNG|nr:hypothetical protein LPJ53_006448 [Coemansia erecta]
MAQVAEPSERFHEAGRRWNLPGTKEEDCFSWSYDASPANSGQLYLQSLLRTKRFDIDSLLPPPPGIDSIAWLYEHMRQICIELGIYVSLVHRECTEHQCPVMRAQETTYYCAGHGSPRPCSAIGYSVHTLDYAVRQLSQRDSTSMKHFQSMVRRLYRIFAHVYFHHRDVFERQESATYLYARFVRLARKYELAPESQIIIPEIPSTVG